MNDNEKTCTQYYQCNALIDIMLFICPDECWHFKTLHNWCRIFIILPPTDLYESQDPQYVIYSMWFHSDTTHENSQVICFNSIQCKCNQPQLCQSTIWTNHIMIVKTTSSRNVCCTWKGIIMFKIIFIHDGCQLFYQWYFNGGQRGGSKLIPDMVILDLIP